MIGWGDLERPGPASVVVDGVELRAGSRVRLRPRAGGDVFDLALAGRIATVDAVECDLDDRVLLAITVDDDPGADLGTLRQPGHRFFFAPAEVEPLPVRRVLVAGIGNVFLGDDGWGVALAERLAGQPLPAGVQVVDYGIRGMDLAYALGDGWDAAVLLDLAPRGEAPGTVSVLEPVIDPEALAVDTHGMDPVKVLAMARALGGEPPRTLVVACEPARVLDAGGDELLAELTPAVRAALDTGAAVVRDLLAELTDPTAEEDRA